MSDDRIAKLSQRFSRHTVGRKPSSTRTRERRSFYVDGELVARLDQVHKELNHALYPTTVSKSTFLETLMEYGLDNLEALKPLLLEAAEADKSASS
jgi:hypothetical protein